MDDKSASYRVYACVNQKGGVGKSVSSTNLGIGLARHGQKVLIVDTHERGAAAGHVGAADQRAYSRNCGGQGKQG